MADIYEPPPQYAPLDFKGNQSPPPTADRMITLPSSSPQPVSGTEAASPLSEPSAAVAAEEPTKGTYRVVDTSDGKRKMFFFAPDGQTVDRGEVMASTEALNTVGVYNEQGKTWDIPE